MLIEGQERIMFFSSSTRLGLKPVTEVRHSERQRPLLHGVRDGLDVALGAARELAEEAREVAARPGVAQALAHHAGDARGRSGGRGDEMRPVREPPVFWCMLIGAAMGLLAGLTGVGGGIFLSPLLLMLGWAGTKQTSAVAALFILVNSFAGLAATFVAKTASLPGYTWILAVAVLAGGWVGAEYGSRRFANPLVRRVLAVVLAAAGAKMVLV